MENEVSYLSMRPASAPVSAGAVHQYAINTMTIIAVRMNMAVPVKTSPIVENMRCLFSSLFFCPLVIVVFASFLLKIMFLLMHPRRPAPPRFAAILRTLLSF